MKKIYQRWGACAVLMFIGGWLSQADFLALFFMLLGFGGGWCFRAGWSHLVHEKFNRNRIAR